MLNSLLGESAAFLAVATLLLPVAGRRRLPTYPVRLAFVVAVSLAIGVATGHVRLTSTSSVAALRLAGTPLPVAFPGIDDAWTLATIPTLVLAMLAPRRWWAVGAFALGTLVVATAVYVVYLGRVTVLLATSAPGLVLGLVLLALELGALTLMAASVFEMLDALFRPLAIAVLPDPPARWPTVAVQVPAHDEPPDLVIRTIRRLAEQRYPLQHLVIQVIDDNTGDEALWRPLEAEARALRRMGLRVDFAHLADWPGYKAGALNWGAAHLPADVEIILIVDPDYLVDPGFLAATVPYFRDPTVAFVQTPQEYRNWESSAFYRACHTGFAYFFTVGMISRSYRNSIIFAGTMGLIRRSSLEAAGGWDEHIITEDAEASLRILATGARGIYVPHPYGRGIMPLTYEGLRQQRFRWAFGGIQILRKHWRSLLPWSRSGLDQRQRRDYLLGGLWWFNDALTLGFAAFIGATAVGVLTGRPFVVQRLEGIGLVLPLLYIALGLLRYLWGLRVAAGVSVAEAADAMRVNLSLSWVVTLATVRGLVEERGVFLRTPKFMGSQSIRALRVVAVETLLALASAALAIGVFLVAGFSVLTLTVDSLLAWSVLIYGSATAFALGDPTRPPEWLRRKAALDLGNRPRRGSGIASAAVIGISLAAFALVAVLAAESGHPPVSGAAPVPVPSPHGVVTAAAPSPTPSATPATSAPPGARTPSPSASPAPTPPPAAAPSPTPAPTPTSTPTPVPTPTGRPSPRATRSPAPTPSASAQPAAAGTPAPAAASAVPAA